MSRLQSRSREDVDRRVRDPQCLGVAGNIDRKDVADAAIGSQAGRLGGDTAHQFVCVKASLHQQLALGRVNEFDGFCRRRLAVGSIDNFEARNIQVVLCCNRLDLALRTDQDRFDDAGSCGFAHASQRAVVAGVNHKGHGRRYLFGGCNQSLHTCYELAVHRYRSELHSSLTPGCLGRR